MNSLFQVSDKAELRALFKALLEAKFHPDPETPEVQGSPLVAAICERVLAAMVAVELRDGDPMAASRYAQWRRAEGHPEWVTVVRSRIAECGAWSGWSRLEREHYVLLLLSPLIAERELVADLVGDE
jgi:hypothetical protein